MRGGADRATAYVHNNNTSGKTRLTIRGGSGQSNAGGTDPIISIRSSSNIQVGYIREDGLISSGYALASSDDSTGGLMDSSSEFSGTPRGLNLGQNAIAGWGAEQVHLFQNIAEGQIGYACVRDVLLPAHLESSEIGQEP